jgi:hypothetical protein
MSTYSAEPGETWATRKSTYGKLLPVLVLEVSDHPRPKVLVQSPDSDGSGEWVPLTRLKVRWDQLDEFVRVEAAWRKVSLVANLQGRPADDAVNMAFEILIDKRIAEPRWAQDGGTLIHNPAALAEYAGLPLDDFLTDEASFYDGSTLVAPWPTTHRIVTNICQNYPAEILAECDVWDPKRARFLEHVAQSHSDHSVMIDNEMAPSYELLRAWTVRPRKGTGFGAAGERDELFERIGELNRLTAAIDEWILQNRSMSAVDGLTPAELSE